MIEATRDLPREATAADATHLPPATGTRPAGPEPAARDETAREAWRAILALTMGGNAPARMGAVCAATDLTPGALKVLLVLADGPRPMRELVETFKHDPSYLTGVVDLLERLGVARREPHPTDRRAKVVAVTERGQAILTRAQEIMSEPPACLQVLSQAERAQLLGLLTRLVDAEPHILTALRPRVPATHDTQAG